MADDKNFKALIAEQKRTTTALNKLAGIEEKSSEKKERTVKSAAQILADIPKTDRQRKAQKQYEQQEEARQAMMRSRQPRHSDEETVKETPTEESEGDKYHLRREIGTRNKK